MADNGDLVVGKAVQLTPFSAPATVVPMPTSAPAPGGKTLVIAGAVRDARMVGLKVGDVTVHLTPDEARTIGDALYLSAKAIDLLLAADKGTISLG